MKLTAQAHEATVSVETPDAVDRGPGRARARVRRCALTREVRGEADLLRFAAGPAGELVPDLRARLPGRGVWLTCRRDVIVEAEKRRLFGRALRREVTAPAGLADLVCGLLERRLLEGLGLARRAGAVLTGFAKLEAAAGAGHLALLVEASDGAADGRAKLIAAVRRGGASVTFLAPFDSAQLSLALGGQNVVHAGVAPGRYASQLMSAARRLAGLRAVIPPEWTLPDWMVPVGGP